MRRGVIAAVVGAAMLGGTARGVAQDCGAIDFAGSTPADGAIGIPTDALLHGRYGAQAVYSGEPVILDGPEGSTTPPAAFDGAEGTLIVTPPALAPDARYTVRWPGLFGAGDGARLGRGATTTFTTARGPDGGPPRLDAIRIERWDVIGEHDACTDSRQDRWSFRLEVSGLEDDAGRGGVEVLVVQTVRPDAPDEPAPAVVGIETVSAPDDTLAVRLARARGLGRVCLAAIARDLVGNVSAATEQDCAETRAPPFFDGCAVAPGRASGGSGAGAVLGAAALVLLSRDRRARRRCARRGRPA